MPTDRLGGNAQEQYAANEFQYKTYDEKIVQNSHNRYGCNFIVRSKVPGDQTIKWAQPADYPRERNENVTAVNIVKYCKHN